MEIHQYDSVPSTNEVLSQMSKKGAKSWTIIWTTDQTHGKGYAGNIWETEKGSNLAVSILINSDLNYKELIFFNQWVCNCICEFLESLTDEVFVKWPNDIIIKNKKVGGILIETHMFDNQMNIITGIGININQTNYRNLPRAGSLKTQTSKFFDIEEILSGLLTKLENEYSKIENKTWDTIIMKYNSKLFRKGEVSLFKDEKSTFNGIIQSVDDSGSLLIKLENNEIQRFKTKEIELIY